MGINIYIDRAFDDIDQIVTEIQKKYVIQNLYIMEGKLDGTVALKDKEFDNIHIYRYDMRKLMRAKYGNYKFAKEAPPVDDNILHVLAPYSAEILKMMERGGYETESFEDRMDAYTRHIRYWNYMLDAAKINFVYFTEAPHIVHDYLIFRLCQIKGIQIGMLEVLPIQNKRLVIPLTSYEDWNEDIKERIDRYRKKENIVLPKVFEDEYKAMTKPKTHVVPYIVRDNMLQRIRNKLYLFQYYKKQNFFHAAKKTVNHFRKRYQLSKVLRIYQRLAVEPDYSQKYIYFPLHYQPEMTTSPRGGWFVHQYLAIEMLSFYAPPDVYIYVKEHPAYKTHPISTRHKELYLRIMQLNNVRLISFSVDTVTLIDHCSAVSSITGSVGYEALFKEKPYIMFGYQVMKYGPGTLNVRNNEDCEVAMKKIFQENFKPTLKEARSFLKVLSEISIDSEEAEQIVDTLIPNMI